MMPNIETLFICNPEFSEEFLQPNPDGPHSNTKLLPSLLSLHLDYIPLMEDDDWSDLMTYLAHQTSDNQVVSLKVVSNFPHVCPETVASGIKALVKEFTYELRPRGGEDEW